LFDGSVDGSKLPERRLPKHPRHATVEDDATLEAVAKGATAIKEERLRHVLSAVATLDQLLMRQSKSPVPDFDGNFLSWLEPVRDVFDEAELFDEVEDVYNVEVLADLLELDAPRSQAVEIVKALAHHLLDEHSLTASIQALRAKASSFAEFLQVIEGEISSFLNSNFSGMTIERLERMLQGENVSSSAAPSIKSAFQVLTTAPCVVDAARPRGTSSKLPVEKLDPPHDLFMNIDSAELLLSHLPAGLSLLQLLEPKPMVPGDIPPDIAGVWSWPAASSANLLEMRARRNVDSMQRLLFGQMESHFVVAQPRTDVVEVQLTPKLLSPGTLVFNLDGRVHPFNLISPLSSDRMCKTQQAWAVGGVFAFRVTFDDLGHQRHVRCYWKEGSHLHCLHLYEFFRLGSEDDNERGGEFLQLPRPAGTFDLGEWRISNVVHYRSSACALVDKKS